MSSQLRTQLPHDVVRVDGHGALTHQESLDKEIGIAPFAELENTFTVDLSQYSVDERKRILRKVDWRVVPLLSFLYLVSFIDRGNRKNCSKDKCLQRKNMPLTSSSRKC